MTCTVCGTENPADADHCAKCGAEIDNVAARAMIGQQVLGSYRILDIVGKGGMSVVYKARHRITDQIVALKILPAELAVHDDIKARFVEEAKALGKLEHPSIVRLYNFAEEGGRFVLAMQYVEGTTFERQILVSGRLDWRAAAGVARQVLHALDYAHARGIVHRDIKPSNILVRADGSVMVTDFGIAKMMNEGSSRLTATGQTMGTVRYMSPEQVRGQLVDARSDIYSLGATLYEAVVGDTPFDGSTHFEIMTRHLHDAPQSILGRGLDVPPELDRLLLRALAKSPDERQASARELVAELDRLPGLPPEIASVSLPPPSRPVPPVSPAPALPAPTAAMRALRRRPVAPWFVLVFFVVAAGAVALYAIRGGADRSAPTDAASASAPIPAPPSPRPAPTEAAAWPEPALVPNVPLAVDQRFEAPELLRILSPHAVDTTELARLYVAARAGFTRWAEKRHGGKITVRPLNLVLASAETLCAAVTRFSRTIAPPDCHTSPPRFYYAAKGMTLYVLDDASLKGKNLPEGVSQHLCANTESLIEQGCMKKVLPPYWDEVEKK